MTAKVFLYAASLNFGNTPANFLRTGVLAGYKLLTTPDDTPATILAVVPQLDPGDGSAPVPAVGLADNVDDVSPTALKRFIPTIARLTGYDSNGLAWDRIRSVSDNFDSSGVLTEGLLAVSSRGMVYDGVFFDRIRAPSAANLISFRSLGGQLVATPGEWAVQHTPAAATQATISRAAGGVGIRHVCRSITVSVAAVAAQGQIIVNLRDGTTGAGAILWSAQFVLAAGTSDRLVLSGLNIVGSANTAMTLETAAAPAATNFASVALTGYDAA